MDNQKELVHSLAVQTVKQGTQADVNLSEESIIVGAKNHREINRRPQEWYDERARREAEAAPKREAFIKNCINYISNESKKHREEYTDRVIEIAVNGVIENYINNPIEFCELVEVAALTQFSATGLSMFKEMADIATRYIESAEAGEDDGKDGE